MKPRALLVATLLLTSLSTGRVWAANATIKDGSTLQLDSVTYRLDGLDAPAIDQLRIHEHADKEIREALFREPLAMRSGGTIKGKFAVRARVTGNVGIYHLQACRSYPALTEPDRWFCSEEDAQAAGFRRAYNCRAGTKTK